MEEISEALSKIDSLRIKIGGNIEAQKSLRQARDALMSEANALKEAGVTSLFQSI